MLAVLGYFVRTYIVGCLAIGTVVVPLSGKHPKRSNTMHLELDNQ